MTNILPAWFDLTASNWAFEQNRPNDSPRLVNPKRRELERMLAKAVRNTAKMAEKIKD